MTAKQLSPVNVANVWTAIHAAKYPISGGFLSALKPCIGLFIRIQRDQGPMSHLAMAPPSF